MSEWGFAEITQTHSNTHIMAEIFTIFHNWSTVLLNIKMFPYNKMVDCCVNSLKLLQKCLGNCAKHQLLIFLDQIHTKPVS